MLYQSMCICWEIFVVATVYVASAIGIFYPPNWFVVFEQLSWVLTHGNFVLYKQEKSIFSGYAHCLYAVQCNPTEGGYELYQGLFCSSWTKAYTYGNFDLRSV